MFGQNSNNDDQQRNEQSIDGVVGNAPAQDFNPALPNPGTSFGGGSGTDNVSGDDNSTPSAPSIAPLGSLDQPGSDDLQSIKQQALNELSPLVSHLDQSPEEKFRTTMMMIQASDNQALIKDAYAAAQAISDEKAKAQALLDIVNEINYFTQQHS